MLAALEDLERQSGGFRFSNYTYTDILHAFFDNAKTNFQRLQNRMEFRTLDLEKDAIKKGYEPESYDMVLAGSVIHATGSLSDTLRNLRRLFKPGGQLLFFKFTERNAIAIHFGFSILPSWWHGVESWRIGGQEQCTTEQKWDDLLKHNGFSGNDLVLRNYQSEVCHNSCIITSTAIPMQLEHSQTSRVILCVDEQSQTQFVLADAIRSSILNSDRYDFKIADISQISATSTTQEDCVIAICDIENQFFRSLIEATFKTLQDVMQVSRHILWVTASCVHDPNSDFNSMSTGFFRTMRIETISKYIITLILDGVNTDLDVYAEQIVAVFKQSFELNSPEVEYVVQEGQIMTGRLSEERSANANMLSSIYPALKHGPWGEGLPLMLQVRTPSTLDTLQFVEDHVTLLDLGPYEVEIEARAWGLNFRDVLVALGRVEESEFGFDCAGIVTRVGSGCSLTFEVGDRVCMTTSGSMRRLPRARSTNVISIPFTLTFADAAAIPTPAMTAYHCLIDVARLRRRERILIHAAAGATGQLAVQIAQMIRAEIFVTVGTDEKKRQIIGLGFHPDHVFNSRDTTLAQEVLLMTKSYDIDAVLNSLSGDSLQASWDCIAAVGRLWRLERPI